jgi:hypothetical protein
VLETEEKCPIDGHRLYILKTRKRIIKAIGIGTSVIQYNINYCKEHPELGSWRPKELEELVADNSNVAYNVIVQIGKLRFTENRQVSEIQSVLLQDHSIDLSISEIELLIDKFVFYLAAVHQQCHKLIAEQIKALGGYILHIDATCEGDSPKLTSSFDSVSGYVLYSAKLGSESKDQIAEFLKKIENKFGLPCAVVSDMSKGIENAVKETYKGVPHYICHYHFLAALGKSLFDSEHACLRQALSNAGISGTLKAQIKKMSNSLNTYTAEEIDNNLVLPQQLGRTQKATEKLTFYLILWILDHSSDGNGYGFPFDHRYLSFYERLEATYKLLNKIKTYYSAKTENDVSVWKLIHLIGQIVNDSKIKNAVASYRTKLVVFSDLRRALGIASETVHNGLTQMNTISSIQECNTIKMTVTHFMNELDQKIQNTTDRKIRAGFKNVKNRIERNWQKLFADPLTVQVNGENKTLFVQRTNNIMEKHFRQLNHYHRRIHGNHSVRRNLDNIPEQLPLVENLKNPNYVKLVFQHESKIAKRFSRVDVKMIRKMANEHYSKRPVLCSRKTKRVLRQTNFQERITAAFAAVAA